MGKGKQGNMGVLSQDCTACNGIGFTRPGYGVHGPAPIGGGYGPHYGAYPPHY